MDFQDARKLGACLAKDYAEDAFRLLVNYADVSASELASRLNLHIRTAQDFLETLQGIGVLNREEVYERKRPYFRYSLASQSLTLDIDLASLFRDDSGKDWFDQSIRERKGNGAKFATARTGGQIATVSIWTGRARDASERRLNLTSPQGRFLYHLPFPTGEPLSILEIMSRAGLGDEHRAEIADLVTLLEQSRVVEFVQPETT
jgi:hypothetical protein